MNDFLKKIKPVPLEKIYPNIVPNIYLIHPTGGFHYFSKCVQSKNIKDIYRQKIWPWIETLSNNSNIKPEYIRFARPTKRDPYPKLNLRVIGEKVNFISSNSYPSKTFYMHRIVCSAFIKNLNNLPIVNHINSHTVDYQIHNLKWTTTSENNSNKRKILLPEDVYDIFESKKFL